MGDVDFFENSIKKTFLKCFDKEWDIFLSNMDLTYATSIQLNIGNRIRPILVLWGNVLGENEIQNIDYKKVAKLAVSVEAVHKSSVIMDDIIDNDTLRRGKPCFHTQYSEHEAVFFSVCLLSKSIENINNIFYSLNDNSSYSEAILLLSDTVFQMCKGAIMEITSTNSQLFSADYVKRIIDLETASLLKNSILLGFKASSKTNQSIEKEIKDIGKKCGYIFQVINDLEPFCNPGYILKYKGNINSDCLKSRKSMVIPYLYSSVNGSDKKLLKAILDNNSGLNDLLRLFQKYHVNNVVLADLENVFASIEININNISSINCQNKFIPYFRLFINSLREHYFAILNSDV